MRKKSSKSFQWEHVVGQEDPDDRSNDEIKKIYILPMYSTLVVRRGASNDSIRGLYYPVCVYITK